MNSILFEHGAHGIIASNLASIIRVLEIMCANILPEFTDSLRARELDGN